MSDPKYKDLIERTKEGRFSKGVSGNPSGRSKARTLSQAYKRRLEEINPNDPQARTNAECIAEAIIKMALKGNIPACVELADRVEGKVKLAIGAVEDDEFSTMSVEELEAELERTRAECVSGEPAAKTPPDGGYTN
jgi:hypothetical protein